MVGGEFGQLYWPLIRRIQKMGHNSLHSLSEVIALSRRSTIDATNLPRSESAEKRVRVDVDIDIDMDMDVDVDVE